jgi:phasin family protein
METQNMIADTDAPAEAIVEAVQANNEAAVKVAKTAAAKRAKTAKRARRTSKPTIGANERTEDMNNDTNIFANFGAFPAVASFEKLFGDASLRSDEVVKRSRKAVEELADIYRGNVDAFAEAGRIAAAGAQSIGQDLVAKSRDSMEKTANTVRTFAEAKSPTELMQLQSDFARTAFDRFVEESSSLTESFVKLAGEAFQPISNRASANVEKLSQIAA